VILLTRLDKTKLLVNLETIKFIEETPDTLISFVNGDTIMVLETLEEIEQSVLKYKVLTLSQLSQSANADQKNIDRN